MKIFNFLSCKYNDSLNFYYFCKKYFNVHGNFQINRTT